MKALSIILAAIFFANTAMAGVLVPDRKNGTPYILISLQPLDKNDPEIVGIFVFKLAYIADKAEYQYQKGLLYKTTMTSLRNYVSENFKSGLTEEQARQLMVAMTDASSKTNKNLALMFLSALTGPVLPVIFWTAGLGRSLSYGQMLEKLTAYTHPFSLLIISNEKKNADGRLTMTLTIDDENFMSNLEKELNAYVGRKPVSPAEERVKELIKQEALKKQEAERRQQEQYNMGGGG
jgi:hypothetical protein